MFVFVIILFSSLTHICHVSYFSVRLIFNESLYNGIHRPSSARSLPKPAHLDKVNSNSLDCGIINVEDQLPPKVPPFSKLQDLSGISSSSCLTPSPAPILNVNSSECFSSATVGRGGSAGGSPSLYPRLSGLHRSMESLSLQMSVSPAGGSVTEPRPRHEDRGTLGGWSPGSRVSLTLTTDR